MSKEFSFERHLKAVEFELWTNIQDWEDQGSPKIVLEDLQDAYDHIVTAMNIVGAVKVMCPLRLRRELND